MENVTPVSRHVSPASVPMRSDDAGDESETGDRGSRKLLSAGALHVDSVATETRVERLGREYSIVPRHLLVLRDDQTSIAVTAVMRTDKPAGLRSRLDAAIEDGSLREALEDEGLELMVPADGSGADAIVSTPDDAATSGNQDNDDGPNPVTNEGGVSTSDGLTKSNSDAGGSSVTVALSVLVGGLVALVLAVALFAYMKARHFGDPDDVSLGTLTTDDHGEQFHQGARPVYSPHARPWLDPGRRASGASGAISGRPSGQKYTTVPSEISDDLFNTGTTHSSIHDT